MNTPSLLVLILGNPLGCIISLGFGGYLAYRFLVEPNTPQWWGLIPVVLIWAKTAQARIAFTSHAALKKSFQLANSVEKRPRPGLRKRQLLVLCVTAWFGCLYWVYSQMASSDTSPFFLLTALSGFWTEQGSNSKSIASIAALVLAAPGAVWAWREMTKRRNNANAQSAEISSVVTVALPVIRNATRRAPMLPDYCRRLLDRSDKHLED